MSKIDYSPLEQVSEKLNSKIKALKSGEMNVSDISGLVKSAREVYERLVILEFQSHDKRLESDPVEDNEVNEEQLAEEIQPLPALDLTAETEESSEIDKEETEAEPEPEIIETPDIPEVVEEKVEAVAAKSSVKVEKNAPAPEPVSGSIAEQFENAPIQDISKAYSLNEKFQYMRVLTGNDSENFKILVEKVNSASSADEAMGLFNQVVKAPDDPEDKAVYDSFVELITRRHG